ncbi:MAG: protein translocase subunit SecD [Clostridiales bacterium]|nr:protein translocase subunit SecD [Clostridiales bacterium]
MKSKNLVALIIALLLSVGLALVTLCGLSFGDTVLIKPVNEALSLGLDLRGGVYTVFRAERGDMDATEFSSKLAAARDVLINRLSSQGYTEASVSLQGEDALRVEIPDVTDPSAVVKLIGTPAHLEFREPSGRVIMEGKDIVRVSPTLDTSSNRYVVSFTLSDEAAKAFANATGRLRGQRISIVLDGEVISAPQVQERISGGQGQISLGGLSQAESYEEATNLSMLIMSGALPLDIHETETRSVSATLGEDAIVKAVRAGVIGMALVMLFMLIVYRLPGLVADIALIWYICLVMLLLGAFGIQLTLPGLAGILLGIGMAVDANVVIFERFRDELRTGENTLPEALKAGFKNALSAILDGNITTLIAAFVLMVFGTGSVKGFSYTLAVSVFVSMFSALVISRLLLSLAVGLGVEKTGLFTRPFRTGARFSAVALYKKLRLVPVIIILAALVFSLAGGLKLGLDFTGGTMLEYEVNDTFETADVTALIRQKGFTDSQVSKLGTEGTSLLIRLKLDENDSSASTILDELFSALQEKYPGIEFKSMEHAGATSSATLVKNALKSVAWALGLMLIYIAIRFDLPSGLAALIALAHDALIMGAFMIFMGRWYQINSSFIAAMLTIVGYSINDTIVVFDRVRENVKLMQGADKPQIVDASVSQSLSRTVNTTVTTIMTVALMYLLGAASIREFTFPLIVGMLAGTVSSNLIAAPLWVRLKTNSDIRRARRAEKYKEDEAIEPGEGNGKDAKA